MTDDSNRARRPIDYYVLWALALVSLGLNLYLINVLLQARLQVARAASTAATAVGQLQGSAIDYSVPISETVPVSFTVAYRQTLSVPISVTLPIDTQVTVMLTTPIGAFPINVPVKTTVPINLNPQVPLSLSVPVSVTVPISLTVPVHVALNDTPLGDSLRGAADYLNNLAAGLGGAGPTPTP
jgi:hypothetical protein